MTRPRYVDNHHEYYLSMLGPYLLRPKIPFSFTTRTMASTSSLASLVPSKRPREDSLDEPITVPPLLPRPATSQRFKDSIVLAPMVRSGTSEYKMMLFITTSHPFIVPTRLLALKYGASLVWGPEIVDKAMLHAKRVVDCMYTIFIL